MARRKWGIAVGGLVAIAIAASLVAYSGFWGAADQAEREYAILKQKGWPMAVADLRRDYRVPISENAAVPLAKTLVELNKLEAPRLRRNWYNQPGQVRLQEVWGKRIRTILLEVRDYSRQGTAFREFRSQRIEGLGSIDKNELMTRAAYEVRRMAILAATQGKRAENREWLETLHRMNQLDFGSLSTASAGTEMTITIHLMSASALTMQLQPSWASSMGFVDNIAIPDLSYKVWTSDFAFVSHLLRNVKPGTDAFLGLLNDDPNVLRKDFALQGLPNDWLAKGMSGPVMAYYRKISDLYDPKGEPVRPETLEDDLLKIAEFAQNRRRWVDQGLRLVDNDISGLIVARRLSIANLALIQTYRRAIVAYATSGEVPSHLKGLPGDPFLPGQPVQYLVTPNGFRVWSVGPDGVDDEGQSMTRNRVTKSVKNPTGSAGDVLLSFDVSSKS